MKKKSKAPAARAVRGAYLQKCIESQLPYYHPKQKCYKIGTRALKGLAGCLKDKFFPRYRIPFCHDGGGGKNAGRARGTKVDRELSAWAQTQGQKFPKRMHPYTRKVIDTASRTKWKPWSGQYVVHDSLYGTGTGTALDLVFVDTTQKHLVPVELKTGFHGYWDQPQGRFATPLLRHVANTPFHQASLQLAVACFLGEISGRLPKQSLERARVLRVEEDGVFVYELPAWAKDRKTCDAVLKTLL